MKTVSAEDELGKVAALCCRALFEFLGHLVELLFRSTMAPVGKIRGFVEKRGSTRNNENKLQKGEITWFQ